MRFVQVALFLVAAIVLSLVFPGAASAASNWPQGIPVPGFDAQKSAPALPADWNRNENGFYYLRQGGGNNGNGYPGDPAGDIPKTVPAGSVVVIEGEFSSPGYTSIQFNGTSAAPVWVLSAAASQAAITDEWVIKGSWVYFDGVDGRWSNGSGGRLTVGNAGIHHLVIRNGDFRGDTGDRIGGISGGNMHDVVLMNNHIHHNGTVPPDYDQDNHGVTVGNGAADIWIVNNEFESNSGNAVQVNGTSNSDINRVFISGNYVANNFQAAFGIKQSTDVVVSDNIVTDKVGSGDCIVAQYGPEYVWMVRNQLRNCDGGIRIASDSGGTGTEFFVVGNVISNVDGGNFNADNSWSSAAISIWGGTNTRIVNNTIWSAAGGIYSPRRNGRVDIVNNLIGSITSAAGRSIFFESATPLSNATVSNNLFVRVAGKDHRFRVGSTDYSLDDLNRQFSLTGNTATDRSVVRSPDTGDYRLVDGSPAVDSGIENEVYEIYQARYGVSLRLDRDANQRPLSANWDIGAYEAEGGAVPRNPTELQ